MRLLLLALLLTPLAAAAQMGTVTGTVLEVDRVTAVIGANVRVGGTTLGAATDLDGHYRIIGIPVGTYTVTASYYGAPTASALDVQVSEGATTTVLFMLTTPDVTEIYLCDYSPPLITNDPIGQSRLLTGWDLENMPVNR